MCVKILPAGVYTLCAVPKNIRGGRRVSLELEPHRAVSRVSARNQTRTLEEQLELLAEPSLQPLYRFLCTVPRILFVLSSHSCYSSLPKSRPFGEMWSPFHTSNLPIAT